MAASDLMDRVAGGLKSAVKAACVPLPSQPLSLVTALKKKLKIFLRRKGVVLQLTEEEKLVRDATTNDKWGPTATQMRELTKLTLNECARAFFFVYLLLLLFIF